jgi:hypothetical protein
MMIDDYKEFVAPVEKLLKRGGKKEGRLGK